VTKKQALVPRINEDFNVRTVNGRSKWCEEGVELSADCRVAVGAIPRPVIYVAHEREAVVEVRVFIESVASSRVHGECSADLLNDGALSERRNIHRCTKIQDREIEGHNLIVGVELVESGLSEVP